MWYTQRQICTQSLIDMDLSINCKNSHEMWKNGANQYSLPANANRKTQFSIIYSNKLDWHTKYYAFDDFEFVCDQHTLNANV